MATISEVKLWADVGYMEGDVEIPKIGASLPTPTLTIEGPFNPSKGRLFSQIQIPENWYNLRNVSYIAISLFLNNGALQTVYGWIDSVVMLSDSVESPMCEINWHVDYWRTYAASMTFKGGLVKRAPSSSFPQTQAMTRWDVNDDSVINFMDTFVTYLLDTVPLYWLYISYVRSSSNSSVVKHYVAPLCGYPYLSSSPRVNYIWCGNSSDPQQTLTVQNIITDSWDEGMGLDPSKIKGAWILPIPPNSLSGSGTFTDPYKVEGWIGAKPTTSALYAHFEEDSITHTGTPDSDPFGVFEAEILNGAQTTDTAKYSIIGFDGEVIGDLPWGRYVSSLYYRVVMSANSCYMQIRTGVTTGHTQGTCFSIPAPVVDSIENAYSTYNYSGQRQYDMTMRQLGVYQQVAGATQSAIGGAIAGGVSGGGAVGAAAGSALGATSSLISAGLSQYVWNPAIQEAQDVLVSKQSSGLLISGSAVVDTIFHGTCPKLIKMVADDASISRRSSVLGRYGYSVNTAYDSCQSLINSGGPLQISNLSIRGNAPVEAKQYVKALFERGVKLV